MNAPTINLLFSDDRGKIVDVAKHADVLLIISVEGARRANHYHKRFGHWCLVTKGQIDYMERPLGSTDKPIRTSYTPRELFWTGPNVEHLMLFPEDTEFYCFSVGARDADSYEDDTVRLDFQLDEQ